MVTIALADTSMFIATEHDRPVQVDALPDLLRVSVVTIAELRAGVLVSDDPAVRSRRLVTYERALRFEPIPISSAIAETWAHLRVALLTARRRMRVNDSWIAATAMSLEIPVVTQDADYVMGIPGLRVIRV